MIDPPRAAVPDAVGKCRSAGIKVCNINIHSGILRSKNASNNSQGFDWRSTVTSLRNKATSWDNDQLKFACGAGRVLIFLFGLQEVAG